MYEKSKYLRRRTDGKTHFLWSAMYGNSMIANQAIVDFVDSIGRKSDFNEEERELVDELKKRRFITEDGVETKPRLSESFELKPFGISFDVTKKCNFACSYCISEAFIENATTVPVIKFETMKEIIDRHMRYLDGKGITEKVQIAFNGGECLLYPDTIVKAVEYCETAYPGRAKYRINTNASLVTTEIADFLAKHGFNIITSLDGLRETNDKVRYYHDRSGTFDDIVRGIRILTKSNEQVTLNTTVSDNNYDELDERFLDFVAKDLGFKFIGMEPDLVHPVGKPTAEIVAKLSRLKTYGESIGLAISGMYMRVFNRIHDPADFWCAGQCGGGLTADPDGEWTTCGFASDALGKAADFESIIASGRIQNGMKTRIRGSIPACVGCDFEGVCGGGCYATHAMSQKNDDDSVFKYRCGLYKDYAEMQIGKALLDARKQFE